MALISAADEVEFPDCVGQRGSARWENDLLDTGSRRRSKETDEPPTQTEGQEQAGACPISRTSGTPVTAVAAF